MTGGRDVNCERLSRRPFGLTFPLILQLDCRMRDLSKTVGSSNDDVLNHSYQLKAQGLAGGRGISLFIRNSRQLSESGFGGLNSDNPSKTC